MISYLVIEGNIGAFIVQVAIIVELEIAHPEKGMVADHSPCVGYEHESILDG